MAYPVGPVERQVQASVALALSFPWRMEQFGKVIEDFPDQRTGVNCQYRMEDVALGAPTRRGVFHPKPVLSGLPEEYARRVWRKPKARIMPEVCLA